MVSRSPFLFALLIFIILSAISSTIAGKHHKPKEEATQDLVHSSCNRASYPNICLRTLTAYSGPANTPGDLAKAAVRISLSRARKASAFLSKLKSRSKREQGALKDCVEQMGDSVDELSKTLSELQHPQTGEDLKWQMSNAETWVSAALTNDDTCLDGFREIDGNVRSDVRRKITNVAKVTSNALDLISLLDEE